METYFFPQTESRNQLVHRKLCFPWNLWKIVFFMEFVENCVFHGISGKLLFHGICGKLFFVEFMENHVFHGICGKKCFPWNLWKSIFSMNFCGKYNFCRQKWKLFSTKFEKFHRLQKTKNFLWNADELDLKLPSQLQQTCLLMLLFSRFTRNFLRRKCFDIFSASLLSISFCFNF